MRATGSSTSTTSRRRTRRRSSTSSSAAARRSSSTASGWTRPPVRSSSPAPASSGRRSPRSRGRRSSRSAGRRERLTSPTAGRSGRRFAPSTRRVSMPRLRTAGASWSRPILSMPSWPTTSRAARASRGGRPTRSSTCGCAIDRAETSRSLAAERLRLRSDPRRARVQGTGGLARELATRRPAPHAAARQPSTRGRHGANRP